MERQPGARSYAGRMRITIVQLTNYGGILEDEWDRLVDHVRDRSSDLLVLPEMPFTRWFVADYTVVTEQWDDAVARSAEWVRVLPGFSPTAVIGSRPVTVDDQRRNRAFVAGVDGVVDLHDKSLLPEMPGWWEARWYGTGEPVDSVVELLAGPVNDDATNLGSPRTATVLSDPQFTDSGPSGTLGTYPGFVRIGVLVGAEVWEMERARRLGKAGVHLITVPRATGHETLEVWLAAARTMAVTAGAFVASSNLHRAPGGVDLGGMGMVISPEGDLLATTDTHEPFVTVEVDPAAADAAKTTHPRTLL